MASERPDQRAVDLFLDATEVLGPAREAFVDSACAGDRQLALRVRQLLAAHDRAAQVFDEPGLEPRPSAAVSFTDELCPGERIGGFELVREIAAGGFGNVWLAAQVEPVRRPVAIKVIKAGMNCAEVVARFEAERQALALMDHANIAKVFDGGTTARGRPYFAMEFVDGLPITAHCAELGMALRDRLELFQTVCHAVQHAHQKGVIHRDLKPNNVLVATIDGRSIPKVIDFGIAKAIGIELTEQTIVTLGGQLIGTPAYMSPEQAGSARDIDTRSDVYSLGVLLYELVCGTTPFGSDTLSRAGLHEILRIIREEDPPRPSTRLEHLPPDAPRLIPARLVKRDLDWIIMRCLEKDRERRYGSVATLANEIGRFLSGDPVAAGPPTPFYRLEKFVRRHRAVVVAAIAAGVVLVAGSILAMTQAQRAKTEAARFAAIAGFLEHVLVSIDPAVARGRDTALLRSVLDRAARNIDALAPGPPEVEATLRHVIGEAYCALSLLDLAEPQFRRAIELRARALGPDDLETIESSHALGGVLLQQGQPAQAEPLHEHAWRVRRARLGDEAPETLHALSEFALARRHSGHAEDAERLLRGLCETLRRVLGLEDPETLRAMNNLAGVLQDRGQSEEAVALYGDVLEVQMRTLGEAHTDTLKTISNLGTAYEDIGRIDQALPPLIRALELKRRMLPPGHPSLILGMHNLANALEKIGRNDEADVLYAEGEALSARHLGPGHRLTIGFGLARGRRLAASEDLQSALTCLRATRDAATAHLDRSDPLTLAVDCQLTEVALAQGSVEEADGISRDLVQRAAAVLPAGDSAHGVYQILRGLVLVATGEREAALKMLVPAIDLLNGTDVARWRDRAQRAIESLREH